jgi:hypothetical protein
MKKTFWGRLLLGLFLGGLTVGLISFCATKLPYSPVRVEITDAASLPGMLIAQIFYPEGVHTGKGAPSWGYVFVGASVLFYAVLWFAVLTWIAHKKNHGSEAHKSTTPRPTTGG